MVADFKQAANLAGQTLNPTANQIGTGEAAVCTVATGAAVKIASAIVHNESATTLAWIAIYKTPAGGTKRRISYLTNLAAGDSTNVFELVGQFLEAGCVITAQASAATAANIDLTGAVSS